MGNGEGEEEEEEEEGEEVGKFKFFNLKKNLRKKNLTKIQKYFLSYNNL